MCIAFLTCGPGIKGRWEGLCGSAFTCEPSPWVSLPLITTHKEEWEQKEKREEEEEREQKEEGKVGERKEGGGEKGDQEGKEGEQKKDREDWEEGRGMRRNSKQLTES